MNALFAQLLTRLDARETKERVLLTLAGVLLTGMLWVKFWFDPLALEQHQLMAKSGATQARISEADLLTAAIMEASVKDLNAPLREQLSAVDTKIETAQADILEAVGELIPPEQMPLILRSVLERSGELEFAGLEGLGVTPLRENADQDVDDESQVNAYRHGFRIRFRGSYLNALAYLKALEALPWRLFWDAVDIEVTQHPQAEVSVTVYTLSLDRSWIGV